jgi:hypothetical protein
MFKHITNDFFDYNKLDKDKIIYHYTTNNGLLGILNSKELHLSDFLYLNDKSEFRVIYKPVKNLFLRALKKVYGELINYLDDQENKQSELVGPYLNENFKTKDSERDFLDTLLNKIDGLQQDVDNLEAYTLCFCEDSDLLSQWKGYAENGKGFSLGFKVDNLLNKYAKKKSDNRYYYGKNGVFILLHQVIYDEADISEIFERAIADITGELASHMGEALIIEEMINEMLLLYIIMSAFYKDKSFEEEAEWRLVIIDSNEPKIGKMGIKPHNFGIMPFYTLEFPDFQEMIHEIIIGPKYDYSRNRKALLNIIEEEKIRHSEIPLQ